MIDLLKVNDEVPFKYANKPQEPKEAINSLIRIGAPTVEPLLNLLRDTETWSGIYVIHILGEIGDARAIEHLIKLLDGAVFIDEAMFTLERIGLPALDTILSYIKEKKDKDNGYSIAGALEVLEKIKDEKSFNALIDALSHPDHDVQDSAVASLGGYGDKRALKFLSKLFENPNVNSYELKYSIRQLASPKEYRSILAEHGIVGKGRITSLSNSVQQLLSTMEYAYKYENIFEGDYAQKLNDIAREHKIRKSMEDLLEAVFELTVDEAMINNELYDQLNSMMITKFRGLRHQFEEEYEEEISIINWEMLDYIKEEKRFYKGLAPESKYAEHPKLNILSIKIRDWLKKQHFLVVRRGGVLWGRKGKKKSRKGCLIGLGKDEKRRIWGYVAIDMWGNAWTEKETETVTNAFWEFVEKSGLVNQR